MRGKPPRIVKRVQIDMHEQGYARLCRLKEMTESLSHSEVIRDSLSQREDIVRLVQDGWKICAERTIGEKTEKVGIVIFKTGGFYNQLD